MSSSNGKACPTPSNNALQNLLVNEMRDVDQQETLERQWLKVRMANHLRLMNDNQRVLDTSVAEDRALRAQRHRMREYQMDRMGVPGSTSLAFPKDDEMGEIKIDSPVTTNHYHAPPPAPPAGVPGWMTAALVGTTLLAAALGGSYLNSLLNKPAAPPAPVNTKVESHEGFLLELVPDKGKAP